MTCFKLTHQDNPMATMIAFSTTLYNESIVGLGFFRNIFVDVVTDFVNIRVLLYSHPLVYHSLFYYMARISRLAFIQNGTR